MSASERIEAAIMTTDSIERAPASTRPRALRRLPQTSRVERLDGPDARLAEVVRAVCERIVSRPLTSAVLAVSVGFVIGGALSFRAGRLALAAAGRHVLRELLKQVL
jgi:hypothetical protein